MQMNVVKYAVFFGLSLCLIVCLFFCCFFAIYLPCLVKNPQSLDVSQQ